MHVTLHVEHTTCVINFTIDNFLIDESDNKRFILTDRIVDVHGNYLHIGKVNKIKKRKPHIYRKKRHGDPAAFDSQIQISIQSILDPNKIYKIKVFRNGSGVVPGVLSKSLRDVIEPLEELERYLSLIYDAPIKCSNIRSVTHNYKIRSNIRTINIRKLARLLKQYRRENLLISRSLLEQYLSRPTIDGDYISWHSVMMADQPDIRLTTDGVIQYITSKNINLKKKQDKVEYKFVNISIENLARLIRSPELAELYRTVLNFIRTLIMGFNYQFSEDDIEYVMSIYIKKYIDDAAHLFNDNDYFRFYLNDRINKLTVNTPECSIVFYTSGKINLHGISGDRKLYIVISRLRNILHSYGQLYNL